MNFSKLKLNEAALGDYSGLGTASKASQGAMKSSQTQKSPSRKNMQSNLSTSLMGNKVRDTSVNIQKTTEEVEEYFNELRTEVEAVKSYESQKSDWRSELSEAVVDGQEREDHPYVTVMPTGDENLIQAIKQMKGEVKDKKEKVVGEEYKELPKRKMGMKAGKKILGAVGHAAKAGAAGEGTIEDQVSTQKANKKGKQAQKIHDVSGSHDAGLSKMKSLKNKLTGMTKEEVELEEAKKKDCKDGYKWDSDEGKCVKKKKSSTTIIMGRGWGHGHHHHDDDDKNDNDGGGDVGGGDGGGGIGEMFDYLADELLNEIHFRDAQKQGLMVKTPTKPYDWKTANEKTAARKTVKKTSMKDRAKD